MNDKYHHLNNITRAEASERLMMVPKTSAGNWYLKESEVTTCRSLLAARSQLLHPGNESRWRRGLPQPAGSMVVWETNIASRWRVVIESCREKITSFKDASSVPILRGSSTANIAPTFKLRQPRARTEVVNVLRSDAVQTSRHVDPYVFRAKLLPPSQWNKNKSAACSETFLHAVTFTTTWPYHLLSSQPQILHT